MQALTDAFSAYCTYNSSSQKHTFDICALEKFNEAYCIGLSANKMRTIFSGSRDRWRLNLEEFENVWQKLDVPVLCTEALLEQLSTPSQYGSKTNSDDFRIEESKKQAPFSKSQSSQLPAPPPASSKDRSPRPLAIRARSPGLLSRPGSAGSPGSPSSACSSPRIVLRKPKTAPNGLSPRMVEPPSPCSSLYRASGKVSPPTDRISPIAHPRTRWSKPPRPEDCDSLDLVSVHVADHSVYDCPPLTSASGRPIVRVSRRPPALPFGPSAPAEDEVSLHVFPSPLASSCDAIWGPLPATGTSPMAAAGGSQPSSPSGPSPGLFGEPLLVH